MHVVTEFSLENKIFLIYFGIRYFYIGCLVERSCWRRMWAGFKAADLVVLSRNTV